MIEISKEINIKNFFDLEGEFYFVIDFNGIMISSFGNTEGVTGYTNEELEGKFFMDFIPEEYQQFAKENSTSTQTQTQVGTDAAGRSSQNAYSRNNTTTKVGDKVSTGGAVGEDVSFKAGGTHTKFKGATDDQLVTKTKQTAFNDRYQKNYADLVDNAAMGSFGGHNPFQKMAEARLAELNRYDKKTANDGITQEYTQGQRAEIDSNFQGSDYAKGTNPATQMTIQNNTTIDQDNSHGKRSGTGSGNDSGNNGLIKSMNGGNVRIGTKDGKIDNSEYGEQPIQSSIDVTQRGNKEWYKIGALSLGQAKTLLSLLKILISIMTQVARNTSMTLKGKGFTYEIQMPRMA